MSRMIRSDLVWMCTWRLLSLRTSRHIWDSLNPDNKVSFFARVIDLESGESGDVIYNKYQAAESSLDDPEEPPLLPEEME